MKANTALAFLLAGVSLWWLHTDEADERGHRIAQAGAFVVALVGLATLSEYLVGRDLGIDQLLFQESPEAVGTSSPGRMAPTTAVSFLLLGLALLLLDVETRRGGRPAQFLALVPMVIAWLALIGYLYGVKSLYGVASYTQMALHTALTLLVLGTGVLLARPDRGWMAVITSPSGGGPMVRRVLPAAVALLTALGWVRLMGQRAGLYSTEFGLSLVVALASIAFAVIVWGSARSLDRRDAARRQVAIENARLYEDIKNSRDFLQSITDASADAIVTTDVHGRITYLSPGGLAIFGYRPEEILGQRVRDYYRSGPGEAEAVMRRLTAEGRIGNYETAFRAGDGRWVEVNASLSLLRDASGAIVGTVGVVRDMTESRRAEDMLSKLSGAVEHAGDAVFTTDREGMIEYVNPAFENLTGYTRQDAVGQTARMLKSGSHLPRFYEDLWQRMLAGDTVRRIFINRKKDGALYYEEKTIAPIRNRQGGITHFVSTGRDVTERKRAEEREAARFAVTRVLAECTTLEEATARLLTALGEGMRWEVAELWRPEPRANLLRCEGFWCAPSLAGAELEGLRRRTTFAPGRGLPGGAWLSNAAAWVHDIAADPECLEEAAAARAGLHAAFAFPIRLDAKVAGVLLFFGRESRPRDDALLEMAAEIGSQVGQFVARELAQKALAEREEQLRQSQKMEAVGTLAGGIAHDFNNLMTVIAGRAELLIGHAGRDEKLFRNLDLIRKTAARAVALVAQLLAFSRRQVLEPRVFDLNTVVEGTRPMLERLIREDIRLGAVLGADLWRVRVDPGQIERVIINLAVNARDAMPQGGRLTMETANVELDQEHEYRRAGVEPGAYVMLSVRDTGSGMDAETQARIFEPFFTTKAPGEGTGLGLSTVYGIVRQSSGGICVDSEPGQGTTFRIYLPRVDKPLDVVAPAQPPPEVLGGTETILLVEDEEEIRALTREVLQFHGYMVLEAHDVTEAMAIGARHPATIDLLVTDVIMPRMSGPALAERLVSARPGMKVLYMSGYFDNPAQHQSLDQNARFLRKPFTPDILARTVRQALDR
jgi:PAS domain S-box-containing protein